MLKLLYILYLFTLHSGWAQHCMTGDIIYHTEFCYWWTHVCAVLCFSFAEWELAVVAMDRSCRWRYRQSRQRTLLSCWSLPALFKVITMMVV